MKKTHWYIFILLLLSVGTHFSYFGYPEQVVFDEVYFGRFVRLYQHGQYYFDQHPPLGKLIIARHQNHRAI
ncbi:phospholipid carrier-dependent glycosyltransferase [Candidatus Parcubacteria bacterium]|nr:phospholipid carrier-dependent glycosyltransferase [Candidatus Parcubacteria bacterium]